MTRGLFLRIISGMGRRLSQLLLDDRHAMAGLVLGTALIVVALAVSDLSGAHWFTASSPYSLPLQAPR